jgi:hypothetical protein
MNGGQLGALYLLDSQLIQHWTSDWKKVIAYDGDLFRKQLRKPE